MVHEDEMLIYFQLIFFRFRFPQGQEQMIANGQGSTAQLSTLTKNVM